MKKLIQLSLFVLTSFISQNLFAALPQTLRFATEATYPPFEFINAKGQIKGFDIDIANALCQQLKVTCTFSNQPWDSLIPSLKLGKFDALMGAISITEERKQQVDFTDPYYATTVSFVVLKSKDGLIPSTDNLKGKMIGIQSGTTFERFLNEKYPDVKVKTYASNQEALLDLVSGRTDIVMADTPFVMSWLQDKNNKQQYAVIGQPLVDANYFGSGYGIAVKKGDTELLNALNKALAEIKTNGTYEEIVRQQFYSGS